jgi:hypothetical protein
MSVLLEEKNVLQNFIGHLKLELLILRVNVTNEIFLKYLVLAAVPSVAWDFLHYKHKNLTKP